MRGGLLDRISAGRFRQTESGLALLVEPVGKESDTVPALDLEILEVRECGLFG
jgi:hypothetical protein